MAHAVRPRLARDHRRPARAGKTEILRRLLTALAGREGLEVTLVLAGVRPEEVSEWGEGPVAPATTLSFAASADAQGQAVERAIETAHAPPRAAETRSC